MISKPLEANLSVDLPVLIQFFKVVSCVEGDSVGERILASGIGLANTQMLTGHLDLMKVALQINK
jgi:hypothetical protein